MSTINPSLHFAMNLTRLQAVLSRKFNRLSIHGISLNDFIVLHLLAQATEEKLRRIDLAEKMGVTASGITRLLLPLEKIGLVSRHASERDARVSYTMLTATGRRLYADAKETANAVAKELIPVEKVKSKHLTELFTQLGVTTL